MRLRNPLFVAVNLGVAMVVMGCGGGGNGNHLTPPPPAPTFTSTPITAAAEGTAYSYPIAASDPAGGSVSFALASGPAGAVLTGNTLTWTPTPEESRVENSFRIAATTSEGGAGTQTFSVTPTGTVHIDRVITNWTASGPVSTPEDWANGTFASQIFAAVPQQDGTFHILASVVGTDGKLTIPNVPGGYYWLRFTTLGLYWTSTSHFDFGVDTVNTTTLPPSTGTIQNYNFDLNVSGLDPWQQTDFLQMSLDNGFQLEDLGSIVDGATSADVPELIATNADLTGTKTARVSQLEGVQLGSLNGTVLGPTAEISNLSVVNGSTTMVTGALVAPPKSSLNLDVSGSQWANLFNNSGPGTVTPYDSTMHLGVQPYFTGGLAGDGLAFYAGFPPLFQTDSNVVGFESFLLLPTIACSSLSFSSHTGTFPEPKGQLPIVTDQNFGSIQYGDPFDAAWVRPFSFCERGLATIPDASSGSSIQFVVADGVNTSVPTEAVKPLVEQVQNPMLNGQSLFTANSASDGVLNVSWTAPQGAAPNGYMVQVFGARIVDVPISLPPGTFEFTTYLPLLRAYTTKTSMSLPGSLEAGTKFLVEITALVDGRANFESSPLRLGLPQGTASVVSALMTVSGVAPVVAQSKAKVEKSPFITTIKRGKSRTVLFPERQ